MTKTKKDTQIASIAVAGCGHWGRNLLRNFAQLGALAAVCDPDGEAATKAAQEHSVPARSWREIKDDPAIDAVAIAAPAVLHSPLASEAIAAGKHVFVEKPLALDAADAERLCQDAAQAGRVLMVGHLMRYHPAFQRLHGMVSEGALGRLQYIYSNRLNLGRVRREENILWSFAPHDISMILALTGQDPVEVSASGASYLHGEIADVTTTHLAFAGGQRAHIFVSWLHPFKEQKLVVVGDRGMAVLDDGEPWERKLVLYPHDISWRDGVPQPNRADAEPVTVEPSEPLTNECQHFIECIATGERPRTDGEEGTRVLRVLQAAEKSMIQRTPVALTAGSGAASLHPDTKIHATAVVDEPVDLGAGTAIWHFSHISAGAKIGGDCSVGQNVFVGRGVQIGNGCRIQNNVSLYEGVTLEDGVFCGPSMVFTNVVNPRAEVDRKDEFKPTHVERGVTIGANATIICGVALGTYSFIAAGAVVTSDVAPHALVVGAPARRTGWMSHDGERLGEDLVCPRSGRRYAETGDVLEEIVEARRAGQGR
jgi:predicted dehydrogenase/acetyltransferase-like isoleucine patch superfamily enzyme